MNCTYYIRSLLFGILLCFNTLLSIGQDFNFSQFTPNRTFYNPAFTGMDQGTLRTTLVYRRWWPVLPGDFSTQHMSLDYKTYNPYGMGLYAISNREGAGFLKTNTIGASYSWRGKINDVTGSFFQLGINASFNQKRADFSKYTFSDELDEIYGDIYSTSFASDINRRQFWDFTVGALFQFPTIRGHRKSMIHTMGVALHHITRPKQSFLDSEWRLPMKLTFHYSSKVTTNIYSFNKEDRLHIIPALVYEVQGRDLLSSSSADNIQYGVDVQTDPLFGGVWYNSQILNNSKRNYRSIVFKLGLKLNSTNKKTKYRISYSYDLSTSQFISSTNGSHEVTLSIDFLFPAKYKYNIFSF